MTRKAGAVRRRGPNSITARPGFPGYCRATVAYVTGRPNGAARKGAPVTHAHGAGTVHNHTGYAVAEMTAPGAVHTHARRLEWRPVRVVTVAALEARAAFLRGEPIGSPARPAMVGGIPFVWRIDA